MMTKDDIVQLVKNKFENVQKEIINSYFSSFPSFIYSDEELDTVIQNIKHLENNSKNELDKSSYKFFIGILIFQKGENGRNELLVAMHKLRDYYQLI